MGHATSGLDFRVKVRGLVSFRSVLALALSLLSTIFSPQALAKDISFTAFPFLVNCEVSGVHHAYYLSKIGADGVAIYISPDNLAGRVTINGAAEPAMGGEGPGNCSGKTLEELRSAGQAFYLQR
ncbi:hypothetical protein [Phyllobacterium bourgognense]|uniref:Uncharacterized protein n=1 Tax=Phyllobacterium bourgognense TaxID=314236 RepID=A0A368YE16_9HYPH|nr:hypothetical protein [Phyllobacterium bourgognense]RCW77127.1 hypothetical protein C7476_1463 [Phyllobacterium bourgognense]